MDVLSVSPNSDKKSPKTPGGISKSLLTPCRRIGLSRKWRKGGCSPFISPLSTNNAMINKTEIRAERKRKCDEQLEISRESEINSSSISHVLTTPPKNTESLRKKSKLLSLSLKNSNDIDNDELCNEKQLLNKNVICKIVESKTNNINILEDKIVSNKKMTSSQIVMEEAKETPEESISKIVRTESKNRKLSLTRSQSKSECKPKDNKFNDSLETPELKNNSINNLTKECIVVIQNKIFKTSSNIKTCNEIEKAAQDAQSDMPVRVLKTESIGDITLSILNDDDYITKPTNKKFRKLSTIKQHINNPTSTQSDSSQSSQEDIDKHKILVKKTYEKAIKPQRAKSTGSITQKDFNDLKAKIEMKKKLLMAKVMNIDTEDLRGLIKKWQKGCQDALVELLELMKKKLPDREKMDYSEMLQILKIPAELVGYDVDNDSFITPDDTNVLLSSFKL